MGQNLKTWFPFSDGQASAAHSVTKSTILVFQIPFEFEQNQSYQLIHQKQSGIALRPQITPLEYQLSKVMPSRVRAHCSRITPTKSPT